MTPEVLKSDGTYVSALGDKSRAQATIDLAHHKIHEGKMWSHVFEFAALGAGASVNVAIMAASGKRLHVEVIFSADAAGTGRVFKKPTYSAGTAVAGVNCDFSIDTASPLTAVHTPTITDDGTQFGSVSVASGVAATGGGTAATRHEVIVTDAAKALVRFTAKGAGTNGSITLNAYEEVTS